MGTVSLKAAWLGASLDHLLLNVRRREDEVCLKHATYNQPSLELPRVRGQKDSFHPKGGASVREETASVLRRGPASSFRCWHAFPICNVSFKLLVCAYALRSKRSTWASSVRR